MKKTIKKLLLLLTTFGFLYLVFSNLDFKELFITIKDFDYKYIILLVCSIFIALSFRALAYKKLISLTVKHASLKEFIPLCLTGAALNIVLPARAGDIFRAFYTGQKYKADKMKIFGSIMLERIFDGLIILLMLLFAITTYHRNPLAQKLCIGASLIFITSLVFAIIAFKYNKTDKICNYIEQKTTFLPEKLQNLTKNAIRFINNTCNSFLNGFEILNYPKKLLTIFITSIGIWSFECLNYFIVITGFNLDVNWSVILFIIPFIALACMIPSTSIFIGPYQLAIIAAFAIYGINKETALAISLLEQAVVTIFTSLVAAIFLLKNNISYKELREDIKIEK